VGDYEGNFWAIDMATGTSLWSFNVKSNTIHNDYHQPSYGEITSSAAVTTVNGRQLVVFGGGGTVYALDATNGAPVWATDVDPTHEGDASTPGSSAEVESSPIVWSSGGGNTAIFVGIDTNEDKGGVDGGVLKLNATTGSLLWKYDADAGTVVNNLAAGATTSTGCGDVWSSPSLDPGTARGDATLFFTVGNCNVSDANHPSGDTEYVYAISADGGSFKWRFEEPPTNHGIDTDFGASPILTRVNNRDVVVEAGKSGYVYVIDRATGHEVMGIHVADGGQYGGFIGSGAVADVNGHPTFFGNNSIPVHTDPSLIDSPATANPLGATALHAVDLTTGNIVWNEPVQTAAFGPTTVVNDVVFAPDTTQFSFAAYDTATGAPVYRLPVGAAPSGGVAVSGNDVVVGVGTFFGDQVPPQATGVWCFRPAAA
jgi:outer membrane protein assembly factor BamB